MRDPRAAGLSNETVEAPLYDPSGGFRYRGHLAMQNRCFAEVFEAFFAAVRPATVIEIGAAYGGFTYFLAEMRNRFGFRLSAYDLRPPDDLIEIVNTERIPFAALDVFTPEAFERIAAEIRSDGISVVCCDGGAKVQEVRRFGGALKPGDFILAHDYAPSREYFEREMCGRVWEWLEVTDADVAEACAAHGLAQYERDWFLRAAWLCLRRDPMYHLPSDVRAVIVRTLAARRSALVRAALATALAGSVDWAAVRQRAAAESVASSLYRVLRDAPGVPDAVLASLRDAHRQSRLRTLVLLHALEEMLAALSARRIEPLVLPGAGLDLLQDDVDLCASDDLDLLVDSGGLEEVFAVLRSLGYAERRSELPRAATFGCDLSRTFERTAGTAIRIALRWPRPASPAASAASWLRDTARRLPVRSTSALTLGPEAHLLHLIQPDRGSALRCLRDIADVVAVTGDRLDLPSLIRRAREFGLTEALRAALLAVEAEWHVHLPHEVAQIGHGERSEC
jgi:hypothetical protein